MRTVLGGECLEKAGFVSGWVERYHDHHTTANQLFTNLDQDGDGHLCLEEAAQLFIQYDANPST